ncbi:MAG: sulfotransferase [Acidimicrobiales bacterium]
MQELGSYDAPRPSFLGIGAGKSGTTWIWEMLRRHPEVFLPDEKELHYFNDQAWEFDPTPNPRATEPPEWYLAHFREAAPSQVCGEFSTSYIWNPTAAARIHAFDPSIKIVVTLRDPVERLFSFYLFAMQRGLVGVDRSFEQTLAERPCLIGRTAYGACLSRYFHLFPQDQVHVIFHHDIRDQSERVLTHLERFIGVGPYVPQGVEEEVNVTERPVNPHLTRRLRQLRFFAARSPLEPLARLAKRAGGKRAFDYLSRSKPFDERPHLDPDSAARLRERMRPDVERLEALLGVNLASWKGLCESDAR